jgi:hypothetical protein
MQSTLENENFRVHCSLSNQHGFVLRGRRCGRQLPCMAETPCRARHRRGGTYGNRGPGVLDTTDQSKSLRRKHWHPGHDGDEKKKPKEGSRRPGRTWNSCCSLHIFFFGEAAPCMAIGRLTYRDFRLILTIDGVMRHGRPSYTPSSLSVQDRRAVFSSLVKNYPPLGAGRVGGSPPCYDGLCVASALGLAQPHRPGSCLVCTAIQFRGHCPSKV